MGFHGSVSDNTALMQTMRWEEDDTTTIRASSRARQHLGAASLGSALARASSAGAGCCEHEQHSESVRRNSSPMERRDWFALMSCQDLAGALL